MAGTCCMTSFNQWRLQSREANSCKLPFQIDGPDHKLAFIPVKRSVLLRNTDTVGTISLISPPPSSPRRLWNLHCVSVRLTLPTTTGQIISPSAATTTTADVTDAAHHKMHQNLVKLSHGHLFCTRISTNNCNATSHESSLSGYRNLSLTSEVIERVVKSRLTDYLSSNNQSINHSINNQSNLMKENLSQDTEGLKTTYFLNPLQCA